MEKMSSYFLGEELHFTTRPPGLAYKKRISNDLTGFQYVSLLLNPEK